MLMMLGRQKHTQHNHQCLKQFSLSLSQLLQTKSHNSPDINQIPVELIMTAGRPIRNEIHELYISIWNKEELPEQWKESILLPIYKKGNKTYCSNYRGTLVLPDTYRILPVIFLSMLTPYTLEMIGHHQGGFRHNRSTTDHIFCILQILVKKAKHYEAVRHLFIDFNKAYDSVRRENLYNIQIDFGIPLKLIRLIKM